MRLDVEREMDVDRILISKLRSGVRKVSRLGDGRKTG